MEYNIKSIKDIFNYAKTTNRVISIIGQKHHIYSNVETIQLIGVNCVYIPQSVSSTYDINQNYFSNKVLFILSGGFNDIMFILNIETQTISNE